MVCIASERLSWSKGLASESTVSDMPVVLRGGASSLVPKSSSKVGGVPLWTTFGRKWLPVDPSCLIRGGDASRYPVL